MVVHYDGSFEGFLTLVYDVYYAKLEITSIVKTEPSTLLFERYYESITNLEKASKVLSALKNNFSKEHFRTILNIFLCDTKAFEISLLFFIQQGFKDKTKLCDITQKKLFEINQLEKELLSHVHKMYGFVRFEELDDHSLYAKIETKFNILPFLGEHFCKRLGSIAFIIHDVKRSLAFVKNNEIREIRAIASFDTPMYSNEEEKFKTLWKRFFKAAAVEDRYNPKLQQSWVPLLYRTYMSEFQDER